MRLLICWLCLVAGSASAKDYVKSARSGQTTKMGIYRSWNNQCESKLGVVTVLSTPSDGTLTPSQITATIGTSRVNPERTAHCKGVPTNGFRVDYTSAPGFRGTDQFRLQFTFGRNVDIDNYTVKVQ